jgi:hypothetical protein
VKGREICSFLVAQHSGTAEYAPLRSILSDSNYRQDNAQDNAQDNVLGSTKKDDVPGNAKEDDAQDINDENNSTSSLIAILPLMTRSTTQAAQDVSGVSIVHHVLAAKETKPNDAMDPEVRINAINKEVRGLNNRRAFSLVHVDAVHSHANIIGTRTIIRLKHFDTIDEEAKARLAIQDCQDAEKNRIVPMLRLYLMHPFASSSALLQSKSILCGLKKLRTQSCRARIHSRVIYPPRRTGFCPMLRLYLMHPSASSSASLQTKTIQYGLKMLRKHSYRARTRSRGVCTQGYLLNYVPSLNATS